MNGDGSPGAVLLENGPIRIKRGRHGLIAYSRHDTFVGRSLDLYGEWSPGDAQVLAPYLRAGMTVLDIGANIGALTLFLADAVSPAGRVVACEPVPSSHRLLTCNLALNDLAQVEARAVAVGRAASEARVPDVVLRQPDNHGAAALTGYGGATVPMIAVDDLSLDACHLVKADVEGGELDVLRGAARTISRFRPVLFLENEEPSLSPALIEQVFGLGYRAWWHAPALFEPNNFFGHLEDVFPGLGSLNVLCLPAERCDTPDGLPAVTGPADWPSWWPDWSRRGSA